MNPVSIIFGVATGLCLLALVLWNLRLTRQLKPLETLEDLDQLVASERNPYVRRLLVAIEFKMMAAQEAGAPRERPSAYRTRIAGDWQRLHSGMPSARVTIAVCGIGALVGFAGGLWALSDVPLASLMAFGFAAWCSFLGIGTFRRLESSDAKVGRQVFDSVKLDSVARREVLRDASRRYADSPAQALT